MFWRANAYGHAPVIVSYAGLLSELSVNDSDATLKQAVYRLVAERENASHAAQALRLHHFYCAALVLRLDAMGLDNVSLGEHAASVWIEMLKSTWVIRTTLQEVPLWAERETEVFRECVTDDDFYSCVADKVMPTYIKETASFDINEKLGSIK